MSTKSHKHTGASAIPRVYITRYLMSRVLGLQRPRRMASEAAAARRRAWSSSASRWMQRADDSMNSIDNGNCISYGVEVRLLENMHGSAMKEEEEEEREKNLCVCV